MKPGTRLGPYRIDAPIGAGGMGEVYRARDTRLDRTVAIKVLPSELAADPQFRERFEREARTISSLEHRHICPLYDVGRADGVDFLVMQYLDGETLAERLARGRLPLDDALRHAIEIADALDKAHTAGIVHRDLKPANVMLARGARQKTAEAKLLDFGLAKGAQVAGRSPSDAGVTMAKALTGQGAIVGTFQYMAPEQIEGQEADTRSDVWAFGCVLYEMLTGRRAFEGKSHASLIGSIMKDDPPRIDAVQPIAPHALDRVVRRCLAKDPDERWQHIRDVRSELQWIAHGESGLQAAAVRPGRRWGAIIAAACLGAAIAAAGAWAAWRPAAPRAPAVTRFAVSLPPGLALAPSFQPFAISPDGRRIAIAAGSATSPPRLYLRSADQIAATAVAGTDEGAQPFFSPDGEWIGFLTGSGELKKVHAAGGEAIKLADVPEPRGGAWTANGRIVFASGVFGSLSTVPAEGGTRTPLTTLDKGRNEISHRFPHVLPDGRIVFTILTTAFGQPQIGIVGADGGAHEILIEGGMSAHYVDTGHLLFAAVDTGGSIEVEQEEPVSLVAVPLEGGRAGSRRIPVAGNIGGLPVFGSTMFAASQSGSLLTVDAPVPPIRRLVWLSRTGEETPLSCPVRSYSAPAVSPNGRLILAATREDRSGVVLCDTERGVLEKIATPVKGSVGAVWSRDGRAVVLGGSIDGRPGILRIDLQRPNDVQRLTPDALYGSPTSSHPDGTVAVEQLSMQHRSDVVLLPPGQAPLPLLATELAEGRPKFSPDGAWLAYSVDGYQYVQPYPGSGQRIQISTERTSGQVVWAPDGKRLYYQSGPRIMAVPFSPAGPGRPDVLFEVAAASLHDISPDGQRFLFTRLDSEGPRDPVLVMTLGGLADALARQRR